MQVGPNNSYLRQYSINNDNDTFNITNLRCPDYALHWNHDNNQYHWRPGHDYFLGNGQSITDNIELRQILSEKLNRGTLPKKIVFCDLDGVLADFEQGVYNVFHKYPEQLQSGLMWGVINKTHKFFETLPWMPNGRLLWEQIKQYDPIILTGIPRSITAAEEKRKWCARELGPDVHVITCSTKDKSNYCISNSMLIDDRKNNMNVWNSKGGKFILYDEKQTDFIIKKIHNYMELDEGLCSP